MSLFDDPPPRPRRRQAPRRAAPRPAVEADRESDREPGRAQKPTDDGPSVESVGQLTGRINAALKGFGRVAVEGEVSRPKTVASGHIFFTLKDERAALDAKIWRAQVPRALAGGMRLEDGARVVCHGTLDVYAPYGKHSLIVDRVEARGLGALLADLERLKAALRTEGLFDRSRPLPRYPRRVGVVTSRDADAWRDFLRTRSLRWPGYPVRLAHSRVQGKTAAREIAAAIARLDASGVDVIVVCRGGGAIEDLWCFNEEVVARAIWGASVPVVSGVGHETDTTLADFVADHRAHTPTDAAQTVLPDQRALLDALERAGAYLTDAAERCVARREERLARAVERARGAVAARIGLAATRLERSGAELQRQSPVARLVRAEEQARALARRLEGAAARGLVDRHDRLERAGKALHVAARTLGERAGARLEPAARALVAVSPLGVLERGYSITRSTTGAVVTDAADVRPGDRVITVLRTGEVESTVEDVRPGASTDPATEGKG